MNRIESKSEEHSETLICNSCVVCSCPSANSI